MRQSVLGIALAALLFAPGCLAEAQQPKKKIARIGVLVTSSPSPSSRRIEAFRHGLQELGYVEGNDILIEYRYGEGKPERLPALAAQLVAMRVDVIVTGGSSPTQAAKDATVNIPIVMTQDIDLWATGSSQVLPA